MLDGIGTRVATTLAFASVLAVSLAACGGGGGHSQSQAARRAAAETGDPGGQRYRYLNDGDKDLIGDYDGDNSYDTDKDNWEDHRAEDNSYYHDVDDRGIVGLGRPATPSELQGIAAFVHRYYALAAAGNGATACRLVIPNLRRSAVEDYGAGSAGPSYLRSARTCTGVMDAVFSHSHGEISNRFQVSEVRLQGNGGYALMGSKTGPASYISLQRVGGHWMSAVLIGGPLP
jgi:hypothetical protein